MNNSEWLAKQAKHKEQRIASFMKDESNAAADEPTKRTLSALMHAALGSTDSFVRNQPNFDAMTRLIESADLLGLPMESWRTTDYAEFRNRDFHYKLPSGGLFAIYVYLSQDSSCEVVEVGREPQPDRIKYEMRCAGDPVPDDRPDEMDLARNELIRRTEAEGRN